MLLSHCASMAVSSAGAKCCQKTHQWAKYEEHFALISRRDSHPVFISRDAGGGKQLVLRPFPSLPLVGSYIHLWLNCGFVINTKKESITWSQMVTLPPPLCCPWIPRTPRISETGRKRECQIEMIYKCVLKFKAELSFSLHKCLTLSAWLSGTSHSLFTRIKY